MYDTDGKCDDALDGGGFDIEVQALLEADEEPVIEFFAFFVEKRFSGFFRRGFVLVLGGLGRRGGGEVGGGGGGGR